MTFLRPAPTRLDPASAAAPLANLGFLSSSDFPNRPGPAFLLVALRATPTLHHYDPEAVDYWVTNGDRGARRTMTRQTPLPIDTAFSWGLIRMTDRLQVTNEYLTFGGRLVADRVNDDVISVFTSDAPILRRGGHSQGWDDGAETLGAFFGRLLIDIDYVLGFERRAAQATPIARYAAFLGDAASRYRSSPMLRAEHPGLWSVLDSEEHRLRSEHPVDWSAGAALHGEV